MDEKSFRCEVCDRNFKSKESLEMHNSAKHSERKAESKKIRKISYKKIRNWTIFIILTGIIFYGVFWMFGSINNYNLVDEEELDFEAPKEAIHWHPKLTILINGEIQSIPSNIGIGSVHFPIHTHEDSTQGILHMENNRPTKETVTLGYFFEVWGKKFSKDCIFDYCTDKGTLDMYVNGEENFDFEKYFMQDNDNILIEYKSV